MGVGQAAGLVVVPLQPGRGPSPLQGRRAHRRRRPLLLRWPTPPYLLLADVVVFVLVVLLHWPQLAQLSVLAVMVGTFWLTGLYRSRLTMSILDDLPYLALGVLAGLVTQLAVLGLVPDVEPGRRHVERLLLLLVVVVLVRTAAYAVVRQARCSGHVRHTALVLGAGHVGMRLARTLKDHCELGLDPIGFVDSRPRVEQVSELPAPLLGGYDALPRLIQGNAVRVVLVAFGSVREEELVGVLRTCDRLRCEIFFIPRLFEMSCTTRDMDQAWGIPLVRVRRAPYRRASWRCKRVLDVAVAAAAGVLVLPLLALLALAVRLEGGPGVLFRQDRVGLDGRPFTVLKLRTLRPLTDDESATTWSITHDGRLGPVGRFLRRTSMDELPQLWNVLTGSMSLVGPRPERPHFVKQFGETVPRYMARHRVPAGLTGWAQVHGLRGDTSIEHRAGFDNYYIENWSLWGDVKIMVRTLDQVVRARGG